MAMNHPFIMRYVTAFSDEHYHYLVMEPCLGGELFAYLAKAKDKRFSAGVAKFYLANLVCALEYLHVRVIIIIIIIMIIIMIILIILIIPILILILILILIRIIIIIIIITII
jgi:serine/threonine protein kinase